MPAVAGRHLREVRRRITAGLPHPAPPESPEAVLARWNRSPGREDPPGQYGCFVETKSKFGLTAEPGPQVLFS